IGEIPDHGLHEQPGQRRGDPEQRDVVGRRAEGLEDPRDVRVLQREAELDAEEPEAQVPDLGKRKLGTDSRAHVQETASATGATRACSTRESARINNTVATSVMNIRWM